MLSHVLGVGGSSGGRKGFVEGSGRLFVHNIIGCGRVD